MKNLKIGIKIWLLVIIISLFACISIFSGRKALNIIKSEALLQVDRVMGESYKEQIKSLTDSTALAMGAAIEGESDREVILATLRKLNNPIRFLDNKSGYFFIYDQKGICMSLPPKQELQGKSLIDMKDENGVYLVKEMLKVAQNGGGFVNYVWPKPPSNEVKAKLSYARLIPGTNFMIGTGIYTDDIDTQKANIVTLMNQKIKPVLFWSGAVLVLFFVILVMPMVIILIRQLVKPLQQLQLIAQDLQQGKLAQRFQWNSKDEIGELSNSLNSMAEHLNGYAEQTKKIADGDLTAEVIPASHDDILGNALLQMTTELRELVQQIQGASDQITSGSQQVADSSQVLSQGATESAAAVEEISSSMNEIGSQTQQSADNAEQANKLSTIAKQSAETGSRKMTSMIAAMSDINSSAQDISKIIKVIDEIAFQTNLLALNAAVEAARAGQHGKGFAVVAEEVRNLAARSAKAAEETTQMIESSVQKSNNGAQIAQETSGALTEIVTNISKVNDLVEEIAAASTEQAQGIHQINQGLSQIEQSIQHNTASAEESAATSEELSSQANYLREMLYRFKIDDRSQKQIG